MSDVNDYAILVQSASRVFPAVPPETVVDEEWGDYADAKSAFLHSENKWTADYIFEHRSIIGFVNSEAFLFLLPHFIRASYVSGRIDFEVLDYLVSELKYRLRSSAGLFTEAQAHALNEVMNFWRRKLLSENDIDADETLADIDNICQQL